MTVLSPSIVTLKDVLLVSEFDSNVVSVLASNDVAGILKDKKVIDHFWWVVTA